MIKFSEQFTARYTRESAKKLTKEIKDANDRKRVQRETDINLTGVIKGKHKRRGY